MEILISAGHSMTDPGAVNGDITEASLVTELRDMTAAAIRKLTTNTITVVEDGADGLNLPLKQAIKLAAGRYAFELHFNASDNGSATGCECISLGDKKFVSQKVSRAIADVLGIRVRGDNGWIDQSKSQHSRLGFVNAGGVIVEVAFMSNDSELAKYLANKRKVADAIAGAIVATCR